MQLAQQAVNEHFNRAISNVRQLHPRPPLAEDAKRLVERILSDDRTQMQSAYRAALMAMVEAS